jgi:NADH-quinone oxidoreductase subunit F
MLMAENGYVLLRHRDIPELNNIDVYRQHGGFKTFEKTVTSMEPEQVTEVIKASGLRGRGGAGFPTGLKWSFIDNKNWPHYVVANADESEPGTFKDREIMEGNPYQFLEGVAICAYAVRAHDAYIYLRGEFWQLAARLDQHIAAMQVAGLLGDELFGMDFSLRIRTHRGAGAYICGEETALLESMEGKLGQPRLRPPFPPSFGLYGKPTIVNNVETLTNVPPIVEKGADWYRSMGTEQSTGPKIFSLSGRVNRPGNYELPLGATFRELIFEHGGGIPNDGHIKAIMAAGASSSLIVANDEALDTPMDYERVQNVGGLLGSASVIVIDDTVSIPWLISKILHFFKYESCGKCTPCREGIKRMLEILDKIVSGQGTMADMEQLETVVWLTQQGSFCQLGITAVNPVLSTMRHFRNEYIAYVEEKCCPDGV